MEWRGEWWDPKNASLHVPGILSQLSDGTLALILTGGLKGNTKDLPEWEIIHGMSDGKEVTLIQGRTVHQRTGAKGDLREQEIRTSRVLLGVHLTSVEQKIFGGIEFEIENLYQFCRYSAPSSAKAEPAEHAPFSRDGYTYEISHKLLTTTMRAERRGSVRQIIERAAVGITAGTSKTVDALFHQAALFQDLVTFSAQKPCALLQVELTFSAKRRRGQRVELIVNGLAQPQPNSPSASSFLFGLGDIPFEQLASPWLDVAVKYSVPRNLALGIVYRDSGFIESRLLTAVAAAESLHRIIFPEKLGIPTSEHSSLMAAISGLDEGPQKWACDRIKRNDPSLKERLMHLQSLLDEAIRAQIVPSPERWSSLARSIRDDTAHGLRLRGAQRAAQIYAVILTTTAVVTVHLMNQIDIPVKSIRDCIRDNPWMTHAQNMAREHLSTDPASQT